MKTNLATIAVCITHFVGILPTRLYWFELIATMALIISLTVHLNVMFYVLLYFSATCQGGSLSEVKEQLYSTFEDFAYNDTILNISNVIVYPNYHHLYCLVKCAGIANCTHVVVDMKSQHCYMYGPLVDRSLIYSAPGFSLFLRSK